MYETRPLYEYMRLVTVVCSQENIKIEQKRRRNRRIDVSSNTRRCRPPKIDRFSWTTTIIV